jgi:nucleoside-diphosphate-sugar epimerase/predicted dehydrogenase
MLSADLDVVHVLLPANAHIDPTRAILESGRHAFVEKPMGLAAGECHSLANLAQQKRLRLSVNHNFLFAPSVERLRREARDGTLGSIDHVSLHWLYPLGLIQSGPFDNWMLRQPQNLFFELGPHLVSLMMDLVGVPDRLHVSVGRPIALPGGSWVFRHWQVSAGKGDTAIDLMLSVTPGMVDRSVAIRAHAGNARVDLERDIYVRDEPTGKPLLFDNLLGPRSVARQMARAARASFLRAFEGTLRKTPAANPFTLSIARSVEQFYATLEEGSEDARLTAQFGANVIEQCERIAAAAGFSNEIERNRAPQQPTSPSTTRPEVLVIGGSGFIGRHLVQRLVAKGHGVRVATRSRAAAEAALSGRAVDVVAGDLADEKFLDLALDGIDVVYHLAKVNGKTWDDYYRQDVLVTQGIAARATAHGVSRFIYTGTIDSYYSGNARDVITSDTPLDAAIARRNHYARSKAACEALLREMHRQHGLPLVIMRPGIVIGTGCPPAHWGVGKFLVDTRVQLWGDGTHPLPFILVEDVADGLVRALHAHGIEGLALLLTDAPLLSGLDYVQAVGQAMGVRLRVEPVPIWRLFLGDLLKEAVKHAIRHPNRRVPSYRDWQSRTHRAQYDSAKSQELLGWRPAGSREALVERGVVAPVREWMR